MCQCRVYFQIAVHVLLLSVTWFAEGHVTAAVPTQRHRHHRDDDDAGAAASRHGAVRPSADTPSRADTEVVPPAFASDRVVFAERPPTTPPWFVDRSAATALAELASRAAAALRDVDNRTASSDEDRDRKQRQRRSATNGRVTLPSHPALLQPVCDSVSEWVQRFEAEDVWGNRVQVVQEIDNGNSRVNQYFYETRCARANRRNGLPPACAGIDSVLYESICYETQVCVIAKVAAYSRPGHGWTEYSRSGDGWTYVKIPAACNCGLVLKSTLRRGHLHDIAG